MGGGNAQKTAMARVTISSVSSGQQSNMHPKGEPTARETKGEPTAQETTFRHFRTNDCVDGSSHCLTWRSKAKNAAKAAKEGAGGGGSA
eukprot:3712584-Amphidinium_carterae.1